MSYLLVSEANHSCHDDSTQRIACGSQANFALWPVESDFGDKFVDGLHLSLDAILKFAPFEPSP